MADHFAKEITYIFVFISFVALLFTMFAVDLGESYLEVYTPQTGDEAGEAWLHIGDQLGSIESLLPLEVFVLIILPMIVLGLYIVLKTTSGILPNWLSGG
jgi:hypothetical protein